MNKKIIILIVFSFVLVNIFSIKAFYSNFLWKDKYGEKMYLDSIFHFEKAWNIQWIYNKANSLYKQKKYKESIMEYKSILITQKNKLNFKINHNIWNALYRIWELEEENSKKIKNREDSIKYYVDALNIVYNEETKKNLDFILNKIKEEKNKQWNEKKDEENNNKNNLSEEQNEALKKYEEALKMEQKKNTYNFNKVYQENWANELFDNFFNEPSFNNDLLNWKENKKDW